MMRLNVHGLGFTLFLGGLSALPPLAIDMALLGLPSLQAEFGASPAEAAAVIAIFIAGFSTAPLAVGPLADRYGRKPAMLAGLGLFTLCALGSALAPSIGALLAFRLMQGVGAGTVGILPRAVIRDMFEGRPHGCNSLRFPSCSASLRSSLRRSAQASSLLETGARFSARWSSWAPP